MMNLLLFGNSQYLHFLLSKIGQYLYHSWNMLLVYLNLICNKIFHQNISVRQKLFQFSFLDVQVFLYQ